MLRSIAKLVTPVAAVVAAAVGARAGAVASEYVGLAEIWTTFLVMVFAGVGLLAVGFAYYWLFLRREVEDPLPEDAAVRAYSSLRRR